MLPARCGAGSCALPLDAERVTALDKRKFSYRAVFLTGDSCIRYRKSDVLSAPTRAQPIVAQSKLAVALDLAEHPLSKELGRVCL